MYCGSTTLVKRELTRTAIQPLRCRSWRCPDCAPARKEALVQKCLNGQPTTFLTLTVNPKHGAGPMDRARQLKWAFTNLRRRIEATYGHKKLPFIAVFEKTDAGEPHLHIMCRWPFISQWWISKQMKGMIDAPIVDIRLIRDPGRVAAYVSKYVAKDPEKFVGCKRYWCSQDFDLPTMKYEQCVFDRAQPAEVDQRPFWWFIQTTIDEGYTVTVEGERAWIYDAVTAREPPS